jgi:hypothetical protein
MLLDMNQGDHCSKISCSIKIPIADPGCQSRIKEGSYCAFRVTQRCSLRRDHFENLSGCTSPLSSTTVEINCITNNPYTTEDNPRLWNQI